MVASVAISHLESKEIGWILVGSLGPTEKVLPMYDTTPQEVDEVTAYLSGISVIHNNLKLYQQMSSEAETWRFMASGLIAYLIISCHIYRVKGVGPSLPYAPWYV